MGVCVFYCTANLHTNCIFPLCNPSIHSIASREQRGSSCCKINRRSLKIWHLPHWHPIVCQSVVSLPHCCYNSYLNPTPCKRRWGLEQIMTKNLATSGFHLRFSMQIKHVSVSNRISLFFFQHHYCFINKSMSHYSSHTERCTRFCSCRLSFCTQREHADKTEYANLNVKSRHISIIQVNQ